MTSRVREDREVKDIDSLLDQVEDTFLANQGKYDPKRLVRVSLEEARKCPCTTKTETNWAEVDELLKDFQLEDQNPFGLSRNKPWYRQEVPPKDKDNTREVKCIPPYLAGSYEPMGYSAPGFEKSCNNLGCLQCDFNVEVFDNFSWDPSTDYLFLRNHMPIFEKVAQKLIKRRGSRAYACQCQHVSIIKLTNLGATPQLKWICRKHQI